MTALNHDQILQKISQGYIKNVTNEAQIGPASLDVTLQPIYETLDSDRDVWYYNYTVPQAEGLPLFLHDKHLYLFKTNEYFHMHNMMGIVVPRSTVAREGIHIAQTILQPGWVGNLVLEVQTTVLRKYSIDPMVPIAQVVFMPVEACSAIYDGKYQHQK